MVKFSEKTLGAREMLADVVDFDVKESKKFDTTQLHVEFEPIGVEWQNQHEWYLLSESTTSSFFDLVTRMIGLKILTQTTVDEAKDLETLGKEVGDALVKAGKMSWKEVKSGQSTKNKWMPVKVVEAK
jgi:hypothetical protein